MATIKAVIRKKAGKIKTNAEGLTLVYLQYGHDGKSFTVNTGVRIPPAAWRGDKNQSRPIGGEVKGRKKNSDTLERIQRDLIDAKNEVLARKLEPTIDRVKAAYESSGSEPMATDVFQLWQQYIEDSRATKTVSTVDQIERSCKVFSDYFKNKELTLEELDISFYHSYVKFLLKKRGMSNNTVGKEVKTVKSFLNYLKDRGFPISQDVSKFKVFKERPLIIYLTQEELDQLNQFGFKNPKHERSRDLFVFQASTGLRWSDLSRLSPEHIQDNVIRMTAYKNKKETIIPLIPRARAILDKYGGELPIIAEQNQNVYIKESCQLAGIDQPIEIVKYHGGKKTFSKVPKYSQISTHKAVSTFITHCGEKGISAKVVSEITGKTVKVILDHYYGINKETIISEMAKAFG